MVKLITVGDQHVDSVPPSSRRDDYFESIKVKLEEVRDIAAARNVDGVVFLGDLFHKQDAHRVPYFVTNWLLDYFDKYPGTCRKLLTQGNHDIKATAANWDRQPIGTLVKAGVVERLWKDPTSDNPLGDKTVYITDAEAKICYVQVGGRCFSYEADMPHQRVAYYSRTEMNDRFHIQAVHSALLPKSTTTFGPFTPIDVLAGILPEAYRPDLYVCGHLHDYYGLFSYEGLRCMNLGSLARGSIDEYNLTRKVKIGYIEVDKGLEGYKVKLDEIDLKSVKPAADVFLIEALAQQKKRSEELEQLAAMLSADNITNEFKLLNPDDALELLMNKQQVREPVRKLLTELVHTTKQEMT